MEDVMSVSLDTMLMFKENVSNYLPIVNSVMLLLKDHVFNATLDMLFNKMDHVNKLFSKLLLPTVHWFRTIFVKVAIQDFIWRTTFVLKFQFYAADTIPQLVLVWVVFLVTLLLMETVMIWIVSTRMMKNVHNVKLTSELFLHQICVLFMILIVLLWATMFVKLVLLDIQLDQVDFVKRVKLTTMVLQMVEVL